jgi:hypothetical protein
MKSLILFIFQFVFIYTFAQVDKPVYYQDVDGAQIPKNLFLKKSSKPNNDSIYYIRLNFENDTCFIKKLVLRKTYGRLNQSDFDRLNSALNDGNLSPKADFNIIQYHPGRDDCNSGRLYFKGRFSSFDSTYLRKLKKKMSYNNYRIYKKDTRLVYTELDFFEWQFDKNKTIENLFFKLHYPCMSFVIIDNLTKNYTAYFGEYSGNTVTEIAKEMLKKS